GLQGRRLNGPQRETAGGRPTSAALLYSTPLTTERLGWPRRPMCCCGVAANEAEAMNSPEPSQSLCVLVVDDDHDTADSYRVLLSLWGYHTVVAYDAQTALEAARRERPDLVLLDLAMPGGDGWELARRLRAEPGLEAVMLLAISGCGQWA